MPALPRLRSLVRNLFRGERVDRDLDAELRGYVDMLADEKIARGMPAAEARRQARLEVGGMETVKEEVRAVRSGALLEGWIQDLRYAVRGLRRAPVFAVAAITTLALGIGANTAMFSAVDALLLRRLPAADPDRLVALYRGSSTTQSAFSFPEFERLAAQPSVFTGLVAWATHVTWMRTGADLDRTTLHIVSPSFFEVVGITPSSGRAFAAGSDAASVGEAVISDGLWRTRFGSDPAILGRAVTLGTQPVTIVGVAPASFAGLAVSAPADAWVTFSTLALLEPGWDFKDGREYWIRLMGRLQPSQSLASAEAALRGVDLSAGGGASALSAAGVRLVPAATPVFDPAARETASRLAWLVAAVSGFVLLIACANVANLLIVRAAARRRELGVRLAMGASRGRVVRQTAAETAVLCGAGLAAGLVVAHWTVRAVVTFAPADAIPPGISVAMDARTIAFAAVLAAVTGLLFSTVPALTAVRADLAHVMKVTPEGDARGGLGLRRGLVVLQVALSAVLLVGAGLFIRTLQATLAVQPGYDIDRVQLTTLDFSAGKIPPPTAAAAAASIRERVAALPGVERVALGQVVPFSGAFISRPAVPDGERYDASRENEFLVPYSVVSDGYFQTLGMPLRGRDFSPADGATSPRVVIVNDTLARRYWPGQDPIGKRLLLPGTARGVPPHEVVGVVPDGKYVTLTEAQHPFMYLPLAQNPRSRVALHVRTAGETGLFASIRNIARTVHPDVASYNPLRLREYVDRSIAQPRMVARLLGIFGGIALLVAAVGVYGLTAYTVIRRTREMGVRIALGARPRDVVRMLVTQAGSLVAAGLLAGLGGAFLLGRAVQTLLFGVTPADPVTFAATAILLGLTMLAATVIPALRAARVDPVTALRVE